MDIITEVKNELKKKTNPIGQKSAQRFFKEKIKCYGLKAKEVKEISKKYFAQVKKLEKENIFSLIEELFRSGYEEEAMIAADWVYRIKGKLEESDIYIFELWIDKYIDDWAKCDTFCNHSVGHLIEKNPHLIKTLKKWAYSKNKWLRRASAVSLIAPARRGLFLNDIFEISDILLLDKEDMVQKGYGWLLKVSSDKDQKKVFEYVMKNKNKMPRTSLRYAIEKMPEKLRKKAMEK
jgi:3-methyladenine DNA glycosylase AlkD